MLALRLGVSLKLLEKLSKRIEKVLLDAKWQRNRGTLARCLTWSPSEKMVMKANLKSGSFMNKCSDKGKLKEWTQ